LLLLGEIIEKLANPGVVRSLRGGFVKATRFDFHQGRFPPSVLGPERSREPQRTAHNKAFHILPPQEWNMITESLTIHFDQPMTVPVLFPRHFGEQFRRGREVCAERFGKVAIDAGVLFLGCDGEGEYLSFVQIAEVHDATLLQ
jgi:hypothetical protein